MDEMLEGGPRFAPYPLLEVNFYKSSTKIGKKRVT